VREIRRDGAFLPSFLGLESSFSYNYLILLEKEARFRGCLTAAKKRASFLFGFSAQNLAPKGIN